MLNLIWNQIGVSGKDGSTEKLWEELQDALNKDCRELFLMGNVKIYIALDDDKVHFQLSTRAV